MEKLTISVEGCTQIFFHCNDVRKYGAFLEMICLVRL